MKKYGYLVILIIGLIACYTIRTPGLTMGFAALIALGGIFTLVDWLSPIRRYVRKYHGVDPRSALNRKSVVYWKYHPDQLLKMELGTFIKIPEEVLPERWVIYQEDPQYPSNPDVGRWFAKLRHWKLDENTMKFHSALRLLDDCGNALCTRWPLNSTSESIAEMIIGIDVFQNVHDVYLKNIMHFALQQTDAALRVSGKSLFLRRLKEVLLSTLSVWPSKVYNYPDFDSLGDELIPPKTPEKEPDIELRERPEIQLWDRPR